jgi:competence protein ComEC
LSIPANVLTAPAVPLATVLGAAAAAVSPVAPWLAQAFAWFGQWPTAWIALVAHRAAAAPLATLPWPDGWLGALSALALLAVLLAATSWCRRRGWLRGRRGWLALGVAALAVVVLVAGPARWPPRGWIVAACDVGQGDALVIATGPGEALVVDAGPDPALVDRCLDQLGVERVPLLVLTHDHADHVLGMPGVFSGRTVGAVLVSPLPEPEEQAGQVGDWAGTTPVVPAAVGQSGQIGQVHWRVLWPTRLIRGEGSDPNNASVVLMVETAGVKVLLTGDIEPAAQHALALSGVDLDADVIKVPHHGSRYQDPLFWHGVSPRVAVVSVGEGNTYGHPDPGLIDALSQAGIAVARTDLDGAAVLVVDQGLRLVTRQ